MIVVLIALSMAIILCLGACLFISFSQYYYYSIPLFIIGLILYIIEYCFFNRYTMKYPRNDMLEFENFDYKKAIKKEDGMNLIIFVNDHGIWSCEYFNKIIRLDLRGYLFQKSYLRAFVIRNLRYASISNKKPLKYLFKKKLYSGYNYDIFLKTVSKKTILKKIVCKGVSINTLISLMINKSRYYKSFITARTAYRLENFIGPINEKIYMKTGRWREDMKTGDTSSSPKD